MDFAIDRNDLNQLKQPSRFADAEKKLSMSLDESEDDICTSDTAGHSMSPFGQLDAELHIPSFGYLSDDNSHPLSYDTSGGGQLMLSQTAWVPHKSFLSPVHIMAYSVINSVQGHGLYSLVKPLLMWTHNLKQAEWSRELSNGTPIEIHVISPGDYGS